jgi:hypothetical protein
MTIIHYHAKYAAGQRVARRTGASVFDVVLAARRYGVGPHVLTFGAGRMPVLFSQYVAGYEAVVSGGE